MDFSDPTAFTVALLLAKGAVQGAGGFAAQTTLRRLSDSVKTRIAGDAAAEKSLGRVESEPDNVEALDDLTRVVARYRARDEEFRTDVAECLEYAAQDPELRALIEVRGGVNIVTGDSNKIVRIERVHGDVTF